MMRSYRPPLRSIALNLKEGDDLDELRTGYRSAADAVTHELEDHCPDRLKNVARANIRQILDELGASKPTFVRVNTADNPLLLDDLEAIVCANLHGVMLPKVRCAEDIRKVDYLLTLMEARAGLEKGRICIMPLPETAGGHRDAFEIVSASDRVEYMISATNMNGDPARSIGYQWTRECKETLYIRQKLVLDTRAAGMQWPICSNWNAIHDVEGMENFFTENRHIGYFGALCHPDPTYIDVANRVFTPGQDEIDFWGEIVALQEQFDDDVKIDGKWYPRNRSAWGRLRIELAAAFGVHPSSDRRRMQIEQVGGIMKAVEAKDASDTGLS